MDGQYGCGPWEYRHSPEGGGEAGTMSISKRWSSHLKSSSSKAFFRMCLKLKFSSEPMGTLTQSSLSTAASSGDRAVQDSVG